MAIEKNIVLTAHSFKCMGFGATVVVIFGLVFFLTNKTMNEYEMRKMLLAKAECSKVGNIVVSLEGNGQYTCFTDKRYRKMRHHPKKKTRPTKSGVKKAS